MTGHNDIRTALRAATADHHQRVDSIFSAMNLAEDGDYRRFLSAQAAAHIPVERALDRGGAAEVLHDWADRRRAHLLLDDLAAMGVAEPATGTEPEFVGEAAILGAVYVLEGSRLGGAMLRKSVPSRFPASFLGANDSRAWRGLLELLGTRLRDKGEIQIAINAARAVFGQFERSGQHFMKVS